MRMADAGLRPQTRTYGSLLPFGAVSAGFALAFAAIARTYIGRYRLSPISAAGIYCCFLLLVMLAVAPAITGIAERIAFRFATRASRWLFLPIWCCSYLIYALGTGDLRPFPLFRLLAVAAALLALYGLVPVRNTAAFCWQDILVALLLIAVVLSHFLKGIWNVPANLDFMTRLFLIAAASWSWTFARPLPGLGYRLSISPGILKAAALNFLYFTAIALPVSLLTGFTRWNPKWHGPADFFLSYLEIFLFIAVLEELFFRGFLQTLLSHSLRSPLAGQLVASCLFGLFHILHAPFPNWRYVALATVAGWFYGSAFRSTGSLMASALLHAGVDTVWRTWLSQT